MMPAQGPQLTTTLMISDMPRKYTDEMLAKELSSRVNFANIDFLYLPWIANRNRNNGHAFVNFVNAVSARSAAEFLQGRSWMFADPDHKVIRVRAATDQGIASNLTRYAQNLSSQHARALAPWVLRGGKRVPLAGAIVLHCSPEICTLYRRVSGIGPLPTKCRGADSDESCASTSALSCADESSASDSDETIDGAGSAASHAGMPLGQGHTWWDISVGVRCCSRQGTSSSRQPEKCTSQWSLLAQPIDEMFYDVDLRQCPAAPSGADVPATVFLAWRPGLNVAPQVSASFL